MNIKLQPTAIIVADCHFHLRPDASEQKRVERFLDLLAFAQKVDHLVMLGDIFDFWFDYPHFRLDGYDKILEGLDKVKQAGTAIHFIGGNHDIWAARYLHQRYASELTGDPIILDLGETRFCFNHGDGLLSHDWLYHSFRAIVRTRLGIALAKALHPEILYRISTWLSGRSRNATRDEAKDIEAKAEKWLKAQADAPWDTMFIGHVHHRFQITAKGRSICALTGWFDGLEYGVVRQSGLEILDFAKDPLPDL